MRDKSDLSLQNFDVRFKDRVYIGSGGFAKVYKAFDHASNRFVALKIADVRPEFKHFTLQREVEMVNNLPKHPNIARYDACYRFDMGVAGEIDFAILKFYEDGNLEQFLKAHDLTETDKKIIIRGILLGLEFLHQNNFIHRDLKCQNILMQRDDGVWTPKITDFGLSRMGGAEQIEANSSIGISYAYAAPEQILNQPISNKVDIWSTGVIIYRIINGELPFRADSNADNSANVQIELTRKIVNLELPPRFASTPEPYLTMIRRCLVLDPAQRIASPRALMDILDGLNEPGRGGEIISEDGSKTVIVNNNGQSGPGKPPPLPPDELLPPPEGKKVQPDRDNGRPTKEKKEEPVKPVFPQAGPSRSIPPFVWILLVVVLVGGAGTAFLFWGAENEPVENSAEDSTEGELLSIPMPAFEELFKEQQSAVAKRDRARLDSLYDQFQLSREEGSDCRWPLALAVHHAAVGEFDQATEFLQEAKRKARRDRHTDWLSKESKRLAKGPFAGLVKKRPKEWKAYMQGL